MDFLDEVAVARQLGLKYAILQRRPDDHESRCRDARDQRPQRAQQEGDAKRLEKGSCIPRVPHKPIGLVATHRLAAIALNAYRS